MKQMIMMIMCMCMNERLFGRSGVCTCICMLGLSVDIGSSGSNHKYHS